LWVFMHGIEELSDTPVALVVL